MGITADGYWEEKYELSPRQANEVYIALRLATGRGELIQYDDHKGEAARFHYSGAWKEWHGINEDLLGRKFVISINPAHRNAQNEADGYTIRVLFVPTLVDERTWDEKAMQAANDFLAKHAPKPAYAMNPCRPEVVFTGQP